MTTITKRIAKLEDQFGTAGRTPQILHLVCRAGWGLALDQDACVEMLGECGFLPTGPGFGLVNLCYIPDGLNAGATERFLRGKGMDICSPSVARPPK